MLLFPQLTTIEMCSGGFNGWWVFNAPAFVIFGWAVLHRLVTGSLNAPGAGTVPWTCCTLL